MVKFGIPRCGGRAVFGGILLFGLLAMTARNAVDPDLWWHLRTGQWIAENGHIPHSDHFSFTRAGQPWISHEWLSELVFYELWKNSGAAALIVFSAIVTTAGFMLLYLRCLPRGGPGHWAAAATAFGAVAAAPSWGVRPQMFTFALASLLLWLLERGEHRPRLLFWIPPLFLLWLNLHAGFALGPALILAYAVGLLLETAVGSTAVAAGAPHPPACAAAPAGLFGARAAQSQRRATLSLSVRHFAFAGDAVVHCRVVFTGFSSMALSPIFAAVAARSGRACQFPLAAQGTSARAPALHRLRRPGRRPPHTHFRFGGGAGDRRGSSSG